MDAQQAIFVGANLYRAIRNFILTEFVETINGLRDKASSLITSVEEYNERNRIANEKQANNLANKVVDQIEANKRALDTPQKGVPLGDGTWEKSPNSGRLRRPEEHEQSPPAETPILDNSAAGSQPVEQGDVDMASAPAAQGGQGVVGQGSADIHPIGRCRLPILEGVATFEHKMMLCLPLDAQSRAAVSPSWRSPRFPLGFCSNNMLVVPVWNNALYQTNREIMWCQHYWGHYRYETAAVRLSNFQTHQMSQTGQDIPQWNANIPE